MSTFAKINKLLRWPLRQDLTFQSPYACNRYSYQPSTSPVITLHKEVRPIPFATLNKKRPRSQLHNPF